jgi:hypothetical protein
MPSFAVSIGALSLVQAALVALPRARGLPLPPGLSSRWWALLPALSIVVVIVVVNFYADSATALAWLALVGVPPFAALALALLLRGSRPAWAIAVVPLFALAWASTGSLAGESAALALSGLACIGLAWLLVSVVPAYWLKLGIYAMAAIDAWLVASDLLQGPNATLTAASAGALPRLHVAHFGSAQMGFGDLFVAATVGCLLASSRRRQLQGAALVVVFGLAFDLLFFAVDELPATVPVALALAAVEWKRRGDDERNENESHSDLMPTDARPISAPLRPARPD